MKVVVTGLGIISAIGNNVEECRESLINGASGIGKADFLDSKYTETLPFAEIKFSTEELLRKANIDNKWASRTEALATLALDQAIAHAGLSQEEISSFDTAFVSSSTVGGMSYTDQMYLDGNQIGEKTECIDAYSFGEHAINIMQKYKMKGYSSSFNTACSSSANAIMLGAKLIKSGRAKRAIVGGADVLSKFTVNGFVSLRILSENHCMPFDERRTGLNLGEGAAFLILESEDLAKDKPQFAIVSGYGNTNDAFHASSISDGAIGVIKSMECALISAGLKPEDIDYINAHGTGTENNDVSEEKGLVSIFKNVPPFQSVKSYTGHTLAASGAIEAVFSILTMKYGELYPSLNCDQPIPDFGLVPCMTYKNGLDIKHVLSNSFGFGGNCSSLIFSKA